jgi:hypothetical protein
MRHREITQTVVAGIDRLLDQGCASAEISERLNVSEYLVGVIAGDRIGRRRRLLPGPLGQRVFSHIRGTDATTIHMIRRMLDVHILPQPQIAIETGVSTRLVERISTGRRLPGSTERPFIFKDLGEESLKQPIRCKECGAMISIVPCRACRALRS